MKFQIQLAAVLAAITATVASVLKPPETDKGTFELLILHNNDMHARFEQTSQHSGTCTDAEAQAGKCYGGFARVAHVVKEARKAAADGTGPPVLYLNAGDTYTGTIWFNLYKWRIAAEFINLLQPDAMSLGNHELDLKVEGLIPFLKNVTTPVLAANLRLDKEPDLLNQPRLKKSTILELPNKVKIGIIGYLTNETSYLAPRNNIEYESEVTALRREVTKLQQQDVNVIIALGHSGFVMDKHIAEKVEDLDLVIGGHSNTFLLHRNTTDEAPEKLYPGCTYPYWVTQGSGRKVPVVQAYAYTKYLGKLHLVFDAEGERVKLLDAEPILLNNDIPQDSEVLKIIKKYHDEIKVVSNRIVGISNVMLNGACRLRECNIGDLVTDAYRNYTKQFHHDANIAVVQGGRIRTSIERPEKPFNMTYEDWITVLPFMDPLSIVTMNGSVLRQALEHSVDGWRVVDAPGQFLQVSGMKIVYDLANPVGQRVVEAKAVCSNCSKPILDDIQDEYYYKLIMPTFLAEGGDNFIMFRNLDRDLLNYTELDTVLTYLKYGPVNYTNSDRVVVLNEDKVLLNTNAEQISKFC